MQRIVERYLWIVGNLLVIGLFATDLSQLHGFRVGDNVMWGRDFLIFWSGGRQALLGHFDAIYDVGRLHAFMQQSFGPLSLHLFAYPPTSLLFMLPIGTLPYALGYIVWSIGGMALFWRAARPWLAAANLPSILAVLTPAATICLWSGQIGLFMGALWLFAFRHFEDRPRRAGITTALMAMKPHLAVLIPLLLLRRQRWTTILVTVLGMMLIGVASLLAFGISLWRVYLDATVALNASTIGMKDQFFQTMMTTTTAAMNQHPATAPLAGAAQIASAAIAILLLWRAARPGVDFQRLCFPAATATFLILPYGFDYDMPVMALGMMLTLHRHWDALAVWQRAALGAGFLVPQAGILLAMAGVPLVPIVLLTALIVQLRAEGLLVAADQAPPRPSATSLA